jgi:hypothetical protein
LAESYEFSEEIIATMMEPMLVLNEEPSIKMPVPFAENTPLTKKNSKERLCMK